MIENQAILAQFKKIKIDPSWAFSDKTRKDTSYITHGYHRYPAKFIPQIVSRLVEQYTKKGDLVVDPFGGCGTTLVEAKTMARSAISVDINPAAVLIAKAKKTAIKPSTINKHFLSLQAKIAAFDEAINLASGKNKQASLFDDLEYFSTEKVKNPRHERIDYWFKAEEKEKLSFLFYEITNIRNQAVKAFFYCGFSNILKNCSIWHQKSNKPIRDFNKQPADPFIAFSAQIKAMLKGNEDFFKLLEKTQNLKTSCDVYCADARETKIATNSARLIVTSPPYVTSYEYADLHQLSAIWFEYTKDINNFRKRFIGTSYHDKKALVLNSKIAEAIERELLAVDKKTAEKVATYFSEMNQVFKEMRRILKRKGRACIVIGNTSLKGIKILNAEVFTEQLKNLGFSMDNIIKREIPSKNLPSTRDKVTGRFTKVTDKKMVLAYPEEYILIAQKS